MKKFKLVVSAVLAVFLCITVAPAAFAMGANENVGEQIVTFSDFTQLAENECLEKSVIDSNGNMAVVGIERVAMAGRFIILVPHGGYGLLVLQSMPSFTCPYLMMRLQVCMMNLSR